MSGMNPTVATSVTAGCGNTFSENCTYFDSSTVTAGSCAASVCKCQTNICQMRLDFNTFTITGPSTSTASAGKATFGNLIGTGAEVSTASQCLTGGCMGPCSIERHLQQFSL